MSQTARGYKSTCLLDFETTFGADPAGGIKKGRLMPINENRIRGSRDKSAPGTITGTRNPAEPFDDRLDVRGDLVVPVDARAFPYWLFAMFGAPTTETLESAWEGVTEVSVGDIVVPTTSNDHYYVCTQAGTTSDTEPTWPTDGETVTDGTAIWEDAGTEYPGMYKHTFKVGDTQPSMVIERKFASPSATITHVRHNGVKIGSWSVDFSGDGELTASLSCVGANERLEGSAYDADPDVITLERFGKRHASMKEGGESVATCTGLDLAIDFGLDDDTYVLAGDIRGDLMEGLMGVSGNGTFFFRDTDLLQKAIDSTESSIVCVLERGDFKMEIHIPELQYAQETPEVSGPQGVRLRLPFQGYYADDPNESAIYVVVYNDADGSDYALAG